jgi:D-alanyl-D-alanine carboxypeptidase (penicillin-binding protein 5/6)
VAFVGVVAALVLVAPAARAQTTLAPKASILVDADTGAVIDGLNVHEALRPASLTKIVTALTAVAALPPETSVPVSARTAGMPAHNLNMKEGQVWKLEDVLGALLVSSANDAGMALAERVSGSGEAFGSALNATAGRLGMADDPVLQDPSGLDDEFSIGGGNRISARDLAIAARALLAEPRLAPIVATKVYSFTGPDGVAHRLGNHNRLLKLYGGAIGMKTGYTKHALHGLVAAATRNGRTMISVILGAPGDTYGPSAALLDHGFATPLSAERGLDHLPLVPDTPTPVAAPAGGGQKGGTAALAASDPAAAVANTAKRGSPLGTLVKFVLFTFLVVLILRTRVHVRRLRRVDPGWPHLRLPNLSLPHFSLPKISMPTISMPKISMSKISVPRVRVPKDQLARLRLPKLTVRKPRLPRVRMPVIDLSARAQKVRTVIPALPAKRAMAAPQHAHPRPSRPRPAHKRAPAHRRVRVRYEPVPLAEIDPKLAQRFEILARTGQVVK